MPKIAKAHISKDVRLIKKLEEDVGGLEKKLGFKLFIRDFENEDYLNGKFK